MEEKKRFNSKKFHGIRTNTGGKTWYADFRLPDGTHVYSPSYSTEEAAAHARDKLYRCGAQDKEGNLPEDYEDLVPALMTTDVAAALVGKSWEEMKDELRVAALAAPATSQLGYKFIEKAPGSESYKSQVRDPVSGKRIKGTLFKEADYPDGAAKIMAAKDADRVHAHMYGSDPLAPPWNFTPKDHEDADDEVLRQAAADRLNNVVTCGEFGPYKDRARHKQGGTAAAAADEAGPSTAPRAKAPRARAPRAPTARAPAAPAADIESSGDEYEPDYDSDAEANGPAAAAAAALSHGYRLITQDEALRVIDTLRAVGITYPFTDDSETSERPDDPHGVLDHLAGPEWYLVPPEAKALWKSELELAGRKAMSEAHRLFEEALMITERMHPDLLKCNGQWPESLRRTLIRGRFIDEEGNVLRPIPGYKEWVKELEARKAAPPPTPEEAAAEAAHQEKWKQLPLSAEEEAELRTMYDALEFDSGLEKYYLPYGQLAVEAAVDFGAYYARKEAEEEIMAAAKKAEALLGPDGLPDVNKVRAFALELGDMFSVAAEALCHDEEFKDWAVSNLAALRAACGDGPFDFLDPGGAAAAAGEGSGDAASAEETAGEEEEEEEEDEEGQRELAAALAGGPVGDDDSAAWEELAQATAALEKKLGSGKYSQAVLAAAAGAAAEVGAAATGAPAAPAPPAAPAVDLDAQIHVKLANIPKSVLTSALGAAAEAGAAAAASTPAAPSPAPAVDLKAQIRKKLAKLPKLLFDSATKRLAELQGAETAAPAAPAPASTAGFTFSANPSTSSGGKKKGKKKKGHARSGGAAAKSPPAAGSPAVAAVVAAVAAFAAKEKKEEEAPAAVAAPALAPAAADKEHEEEKEQEAPAAAERPAAAAEVGNEEEETPIPTPADPIPAKPVPAAAEKEKEEEKAPAAVAAPAPVPGAAIRSTRAAGRRRMTMQDVAAAAANAAQRRKVTVRRAATSSSAAAEEEKEEEAPPADPAPVQEFLIPSAADMAAFEADMMALPLDELLAAMGGDLEALTRSTAAAYAAAGMPLTPELAAALEHLNVQEAQQEDEIVVDNALEDAAEAFDIPSEEFAARWDAVLPGLAAKVADAMAGPTDWEAVDAALEEKLEALDAAVKTADAALEAADNAGADAIDAGWRGVRENEWNWKISLARRQGRDGVAWLEHLLGPEWPRMLRAHPNGNGVFGPHRAPPQIHDPLLIMGVYNAHLYPGQTQAKVLQAVGEAALCRLQIWGSRFYDSVWRYWGPVINAPDLVNRYPVPGVQVMSHEATLMHWVPSKTKTEADAAFVADRQAKIERAGPRTRKDTVYL